MAALAFYSGECPICYREMLENGDYSDWCPDCDVEQVGMNTFKFLGQKYSQNDLIKLFKMKALL